MFVSMFWTDYMLRGLASGRQQRAEEVMIGCVHDVVTVRVLPPASTQIIRIARAKLGHAVFNLLEPAMERQRVFYNESIIVQPLAGDVHNPWRLITSPVLSRERRVVPFPKGYTLDERENSSPVRERAWSKISQWKLTSKFA